MPILEKWVTTHRVHLSNKIPSQAIWINFLHRCLWTWSESSKCNSNSKKRRRRQCSTQLITIIVLVTINSRTLVEGAIKRVGKKLQCGCQTLLTATVSHRHNKTHLRLLTKFQLTPIRIWETVKPPQIWREKTSIQLPHPLQLILRMANPFNPLITRWPFQKPRILVKQTVLVS